MFVGLFRSPSALTVAALLCLTGGALGQTRDNDYPTAAVVDYVYACMKVNGETPESLAACSCSADVVASIVPYERYVEASTFLSMMQMQGEGAELFRSAAESKASIQDLRRAQAEADIRCFSNAS